MGKRGFLRRLSVTVLLTLLALLFLAPMVLTVAGSFMSGEELTESYGVIFGDEYMKDPVKLKFIPEKPTVEQYGRLAGDRSYTARLLSSVLYTVSITVFGTAASALAAYGFTRYRSRGRRLTFLGFSVLMLMPYQVTLVPNYFVSKWLGTFDTPLAIILPGVFSAFGVYLLTKYMARVPKDTMEAARIDGAGEWRVFLRVCLPQCKSAVWAVALLTFFDNWNMVEGPLVLLRDESARPLSVYLSRLNADEPGMAFAAAAMYMIPCLALFIFGQRHLAEGINSKTVTDRKI